MVFNCKTNADEFLVKSSAFTRRQGSLVVRVFDTQPAATGFNLRCPQSTHRRPLTSDVINPTCTLMRRT